jgi:modification methylase
VHYATYEDRLPHAQYVSWQHAILTLCWDTLSDTGAIFYNHKPRVIGAQVWLPTELNPGLPLRQIVIWARAGGMNYNPTAYVPTHEWLMIFAKPDWRLKSKAASGAGDVWAIPQQPNPDHPAPFPVALPLRALETLTPGIVCDPFMGQGSTAIACVRLGLPFIGIDMDRRYFALTCRHVEQAYAQTEMFNHPATMTPQQLTLA